MKAPHAGQFNGQPKGNFRTKAMLESFWNPVDNQTAGQIGQMGKDRDHAPAQLYGAEKYTNAIIRQADALNIPVGGQSGTDLQFPFDQYHDWCRHTEAALRRIRETPDHNMEGWEKCGFVRSQWRECPESNLWLDRSEFAALPETTRAIIARRLESNPALVRTEYASRADITRRFAHTLKKLPLRHVPEILGRDFALVNRKTGEHALRVGAQIAGCFSFQCEEIDCDTLHYYARDERGFLPAGAWFVPFVNPYMPQYLIACDEALRLVAVCERYDRAHDDASLKKAMGAQAQHEGEARMRLNLRHDDAAKQLREMKAHNAEVLADGGDASPSPLCAAQRGEGRGEVSDCTTELLEREVLADGHQENKDDCG